MKHGGAGGAAAPVSQQGRTQRGCPTHNHCHHVLCVPIQVNSSTRISYRPLRALVFRLLTEGGKILSRLASNLYTKGDLLSGPTTSCTGFTCPNTGDGGEEVSCGFGAFAELAKGMDRIS